jgi:hypothetical protein
MTPPRSTSSRDTPSIPFVTAVERSLRELLLQDAPLDSVLGRAGELG